MRIFANNSHKTETLLEVIRILNENNLSINSTTVRPGKNDISTILVTFEVHSTAQLNAMMNRIRQIDYVVDEFIRKYWPIKKEQVTTKMMADVLRVADPLSRRHIVAQRVVIESISELHSKEQLQKLDRIMDWLAMNPKLLK